MTPQIAILFLKTWIAEYLISGIFSNDEIGHIFGAIQLLEDTIKRIVEFSEMHKD